MEGEACREQCALGRAGSGVERDDHGRRGLVREAADDLVAAEEGAAEGAARLLLQRQHGARADVREPQPELRLVQLPVRNDGAETGREKHSGSEEAPLPLCRRRSLPPSSLQHTGASCPGMSSTPASSVLVSVSGSQRNGRANPDAEVVPASSTAPSVGAKR